MKYLLPYKPLEKFELCCISSKPNLVSSKSREFLSSLVTLRIRTDYHYLRLIHALNDPFFSATTRDLLLDKEDSSKNHFERLEELETIFDAELAAMLQAIRSQLDVFGQVINQELDLGISVNAVSFNGTALVTNLRDTSLKTVIENIINDPYFQYINDFVNLNKHIKTTSVHGSGGMNLETLTIDVQKFFQISNFQNKGDLHDNKLIIEVLAELKPWIHDVIKILGTHLKQEQIKRLDSLGEWHYGYPSKAALPPQEKVLVKMPTETLDAIKYALEQTDVEGDPITIRRPMSLVSFVREYFDKHNIDYGTYSYEDLVPFFDLLNQ
jgi:hypothetical protein